MPKLVIVASGNPVKRRAVAQGFDRLFPDADFAFETMAVPSGVDDQPRTDDETRRGARQRSEAAARTRPDADFWVGVEGGIEDGWGDGRDEMHAFAWIVVAAASSGRSAAAANTLRFGTSRSATFALPEAVATLVRGGKELGEADDIVFGTADSKRKGGAVGLLTGGAIDRTALYEQAVVLALIPFR